MSEPAAEDQSHAYIQLLQAALGATDGVSPQHIRTLAQLLDDLEHGRISAADAQGRITTNAHLAGMMQQGTAPVPHDTASATVSIDSSTITDSTVTITTAGRDVVQVNVQVNEDQTVIRLPPEPKDFPLSRGFVGRAQELAALSMQLKQEHAVLLTGMPGLGKTALAARLALQQSDKNRFWHTFHAGEGLTPLLWALSGFLAWNLHSDAWLLLESARQHGVSTPPNQLVIDYVLQAMRGQGYLLCLDDLHLAEVDPQFEPFARQLWAEVQAGQLDLIATSRQHPSFAPAAAVTPLHGLSLDDTHVFATDRGLPLTPDALKDLHAATEGNSQLLNLAVTALRQSPNTAALIVALATTHDIETFLMREIDDQLTSTERSIMQAIAILGGYPGTRDAIEAILDSSGLKRTLHVLSRSYLLTEQVVAGEQEYGQHAIIRSYYYTQLSKRERKTMHRRAADYYEHEEPQPLRAAQHFLSAGESDRAAELLTRDIWAIINQGQAHAASQLLRAVTPQPSSPERMVAVALACGALASLLGEHESAKASYQEALDVLDRTPPHSEAATSWVRAYSGLAQLLQLDSPRDALALFDQALGRLSTAGTTEQAHLLIYSGVALIDLSEFDEAETKLKDGLALLAATPDRFRAKALNNLGFIACLRGDTEQGRRYYADVLAIDRQLQDRWGEAEVRHNLGIEEEIAGNWEVAAEQYAQALAIAHSLGSVSQQAKLELALGILAMNRGQDSEAHSHLTHSLELATRHDLTLHQIYINASLADLYLRQDRPADAAPHSEIAHTLAMETESRDQLPEIYRLQGLIALRSGALDQADHLVTQALALAEELDIPLEHGIALRTHGAILHATQQADALIVFSRSLEILQEHDPFETARTHLALGEALADPSPIEAIQHLTEALTMFEHLGAQREARIARQLLHSGQPSATDC